MTKQTPLHIRLSTDLQRDIFTHPKTAEARGEFYGQLYLIASDIYDEQHGNTMTRQEFCDAWVYTTIKELHDWERRHLDSLLIGGFTPIDIRNAAGRVC